MIELPSDLVVDVVQAEYLNGYRLQISFSDGHVSMVDFGPFLTSSHHPLVRSYLDVNLFRDFTVEGSNLFWHDYALCFPVADLYEGIIR